MIKDSNNFKAGISLVDELLVDIMGSLIPGFLFLTLLFICMFIPLAIFSNWPFYAVIERSNSSGLFWVSLIIILILAYVVGHIFYRADITQPDKIDIQREIGKVIKTTREQYRGDDTEYRNWLKSELRKIIFTMYDASRNVPQFTQWFDEESCQSNDVSMQKASPMDTSKHVYMCFCYFIMELVKAMEKEEDKDIPFSYFLGVLFPEEAYRISREKQPTKPFGYDTITRSVAFEDLDLEIQRIWEKYEKSLSEVARIGIKPITDNELLRLSASLCILNVQIEIGCISPKECFFPYIYYYKYLLKRNINQLFEEVKWNSREGRSKNIINEYKTAMQLFVPEKYAILNKNESHVRMSSSTWHMAGLTRWIAGGMSIISTILAIVVCTSDDSHTNNGISTTPYHAFLATALSLTVVVFSQFARLRIARFIHYQRSREIFHTICAYNQCHEIIKRRKFLQETELHRSNQASTLER